VAQLVRLGRGFVLLVGLGQRPAESGLHVGQDDAVLGQPGAGDAGLHGAHVQVQGVGVLGIGRVVGPEELLLLGVPLHQIDEGLVPAGAPQVVQGFLVHREEAHGRPVLGRHVGDGGPVGQAQLAEARAVELDELVHDALLAQHLRDGKDQVRRGGSFRQLAGELEAHHLGQAHVIGLSQHHGLRFDAAYAPAEHPEAVHHGGVRVGSHQGVGERHLLAVHFPELDHFGQVLQVHLVDDAPAGGTTRKLRNAFWAHFKNM